MHWQCGCVFLVSFNLLTKERNDDVYI
jgi:hypothetical protein